MKKCGDQVGEGKVLTQEVVSAPFLDSAQTQGAVA